MTIASASDLPQIRAGSSAPEAARRPWHLWDPYLPFIVLLVDSG